MSANERMWWTPCSQEDLADLIKVSLPQTSSDYIFLYIYTHTHTYTYIYICGPFYLKILLDSFFDVDHS